MKQQTQHLHTQLEHTVDIFRHLSSFNDYLHVLKLFFGFYSPIEAQIASISGIDAVDFEVRRKIPLLRADLSALGMQNSEIAAIPHCANLPRLDELSRAFGYLYVAEGSTLGGQVISKHVGNLLGIGIGMGAAFFNGYGDVAVYLRSERALGAFHRHRVVVVDRDGDPGGDGNRQFTNT